MTAGLIGPPPTRLEVYVELSLPAERMVLPMAGGVARFKLTRTELRDLRDRCTAMIREIGDG